MGCRCCKMVKRLLGWEKHTEPNLVSSYMIDQVGSVEVTSRGQLNNVNNTAKDSKPSGDVHRNPPHLVNFNGKNEIKAFNNRAPEADVNRIERKHDVNRSQHVSADQKETVLAEQIAKCNIITSGLHKSESDDTLHGSASYEKQIIETDHSDASNHFTDSMESILSDTQMEVVSQQPDMGYDTETDEPDTVDCVSQCHDIVQEANSIVSNGHGHEQNVKSPEGSISLFQSQTRYVHINITDLANETMLAENDILDITDQAEVDSSYGELNPTIDAAEEYTQQEEPIDPEVSRCAQEEQVEVSVSSLEVRYFSVEPDSQEDPDVTEALAALEAATAGEDDDY